MKLQLVKSPFLNIFIVTLVMYVFLAYLFPITFYPDSEQYVRTAKAILNQNNGEFYYYRTWGYPLVMNLLGVTTINSFYPLLILQLICAALIPALIYATLANIYPKIAVTASMIAAISFAPALLSNVIMTDEVSMFLRYLLLYLASNYIFYNNENKYLIFMGILGFFLYLMRPADALTFLIIPTVMFLFKVGSRKNLIITIFLFLVSVSVFGLIRDKVSLHYMKKHHVHSISTVGSMVGRMLFFNAYAVGPKLIKSSTIIKENGKYTDILLNTITHWGEHDPSNIKKYSIQGGQAFPTLYNNVKTPEEFVTALLKEEGLFAHWIMWIAMDEELGAYQADKVFLRAALEAYLDHPKILLLLYDGIIEFFLAGDVVYNSGIKETWNSHPALSVYIPTDQFPDQLKKELQKSSNSLSQFVSPVSEFLFFWITFFKIIAVIFALAFLPANFIVKQKLSCFSFIIISTLLYHAQVAVAFAAPHFRYIVPHVPLIIMLAILGLTSFKKKFMSQTLPEVVKY